MRTKGEKGYTKKPSKKEVSKAHVLVCRVGQKCPVCQRRGSVARREYGDHIFLRRVVSIIPGIDPEELLPLECTNCKRRFEEKEEEKVLACHIGQKCPLCKTPGSIVKRDEGNHISIGDGMAPCIHLKADAFLPLECNFCKSRFKKAREPLLSVCFKKVHNLFFSRSRKTLI